MLFQRDFKKGFTLVELIFYVALTGVLVLVLSQFAVTMSTSYNKGTTVNYLQENGRMAMQRITQEIRRALSVEMGWSLFDVDPGKLQLRVNDVDTPVVIERIGSDLQIVLGTNGPYSLLDSYVGVQSLVFTDLSPASDATNIGVDLILKNVGDEVVPDTAHTLSLSTAVSLRL